MWAWPVRPSAEAVLGPLSLVLWTLFIVTTVKYVSFAMSVDNDGEGGIIALMALFGVKRQQRPTIVAVGLFGAALIYGDGAITPAISVLSALEGLNMATPALQPYVVPGRGRDPACAVRDPVAGNGGDRQYLRTGHAGLVRRHRGDGDIVVSVRRSPRSTGPWHDLYLERRYRLDLGAVFCVAAPKRCRYRPFRQGPDQARLVCGRLPDPELPGRRRS